MDDVSDRSAADAGRAVPRQCRSVGRLPRDRRATDDVVRGEVLEEVADPALDEEAEEHTSFDVLLGPQRFRSECRHRLESD